MKCIVVVPAYNEEKNLRPVLQGVFSHRPDDMVVVVDDGSADNTVTVAQEVGAGVLRHLVNRGQGAALRTGTEYALNQGAEVVVHFDADGQFDPAEIAGLIEPIVCGEADVVLGSRFLKENNIPWTKKHLILPIARLVNYFFTGLKLTDAHNGFRALSRQAAEAIEINQDRMAHNSEIVRQVREKNFRFLEVPVSISYSRYGQGVGGGLKIIKDLLLDKIL
jgi:glycosyltransferase involved in cell wall biosynthesis